MKLIFDPGWGKQKRRNSGQNQLGLQISTAFPSATVDNMPAKAGDSSLIPGSGRPLEQEMATHSSILAWQIPWREEPDRLQYMGHKE